jgi:hypothetical protein
MWRKQSVAERKPKRSSETYDKCQKFFDVCDICSKVEQPGELHNQECDWCGKRVCQHLHYFALEDSDTVGFVQAIEDDFLCDNCYICVVIKSLNLRARQQGKKTGKRQWRQKHVEETKNSNVIKDSYEPGNGMNLTEPVMWLPLDESAKTADSDEGKKEM